MPEHHIVSLYGRIIYLFSAMSNSLACEGLVIDYEDLKAGKNLQSIIEQAYGPQGHGILFVSNIPDFVQVRAATLPLFTKLAHLPQQTLNKYMRPEIYHSLGWSCGVEKFHGKYDTTKGSYYVNCCTDDPEPITQENAKYYTEDEIKKNAGNKWIDQIPQIEKNVKALSRIMIDTGALLAKQIDSYTEKKVPSYKKGHLNRIVEKGHSHIGRILHYFPYKQKGDTEDDWCGWHNDHGALTALTSAMYVDEEGKEFKIASKSGGLFAQNRFSEMTRIGIPPDMLAFQLGESTQIISGGHLEATPHCVVRSEDIAGKKIGRNTFALFMEPDPLEVMEVPEGVDPEGVQLIKAYKIPQLKERWENKMFFKDFHMKTIKEYS